MGMSVRYTIIYTVIFSSMNLHFIAAVKVATYRNNGTEYIL